MAGKKTNNKKTDQPDFFAFEDWRVDGLDENWPAPTQSDIELTDAQKKIAQRNAALLLCLCNRL